MVKILVVDDDIHATTLFKTILTAKGYDAIIVNDSATAVQVANTTNPELIILDLMMPEPNGFDVCKMLRADPKFSRTPIVIFTAMGDSESQETASEIGADEFLTKPFRVEELMLKIQTLLAQSKKA